MQKYVSHLLFLMSISKRGGDFTIHIGKHQPFYISIYISTLPSLETSDYTIRIGSTPTFLYFDLYLYSAYTAHYVLKQDSSGHG